MTGVGKLHRKRIDTNKRYRCEEQEQKWRTMNYSTAPSSRHHGHLCHLIKKLENRYGADEEVLAPLRGELAKLDKHLSAGAQVRSANGPEDVAAVTRKFWDSHYQRLQRV